MSLSRLILTQFKNYPYQDFKFHPSIQCLSGPNGTGKTNILDAIYMLCIGKSHFQSQDAKIIQWHKDFYRIVGHFDHDKTVVKYAPRSGKSIEYNDKKYEKVRDHLGKNTVIFVGPDDIELVNGASAIRRRWMDIALCQVDHHYLGNLSSYSRILRQRNTYLKSITKGQFEMSLIESYNTKMIPFGEALHAKRIDFIQSIEKYIERLYHKISHHSEQIKIRYKSDLLVSPFGDLLTQNIQKDLYLKRTTHGPHRDDFEMILDDNVGKSYASQGQKKSLLFALQLALSEWLYQDNDKKPILILDDVFDKLDPDRAGNLLDLVCTGHFEQIFLSDAHPTRLKDYLESMELSFGYLHLSNQSQHDEEAE